MCQAVWMEPLAAKQGYGPRLRDNGHRSAPQAGDGRMTRRQGLAIREQGSAAPGCKLEMAKQKERRSDDLRLP